MENWNPSEFRKLQSKGILSVSLVCFKIYTKIVEDKFRKVYQKKGNGTAKVSIMRKMGKKQLRWYGLRKRNNKKNTLDGFEEENKKKETQKDQRINRGSGNQGRKKKFGDRQEGMEKLDY